MLCDRCNVNPATVHLKTMLNGIVEEKHLCQKCAKETGQLQLFNITNPFTSFFETLLGSMEYQPKLLTSQCSACGSTFDQFRRTGQLGCPTCYREFDSELQPILRRIQGDVVHRGKIPVRQGGSLMVKRQIERLREELKELVRREEYEKAAKVRDEIRKLEKTAEGVRKVAKKDIFELVTPG